MHGRKRVEAELFGNERRVLVGEDDRRRDPARDQRFGYRSQLDRFRPGPDDQPYV
jgi:hypothetical protein